MKELIVDKSKTHLVILAGGQSKRFGGGFKTLHKFNNVSLLKRILNNFKNLNIEIALNINSDEREFFDTGLHLIRDQIGNFQGPLAGIYSSIKWVIQNNKNIEWVLTTPSDTPFLFEEIINKFFETEFKENSEIILAKSADKIHPVIGLWHVSLLKRLCGFLEKKDRKIMNWVNMQNYEILNFENENYFFNINTKSDLEEATKIENSLKIQ
ncbi:MAG: molybdenum cofactor guanylyltransferase [Rickettsiales bacterium]|nr:molybdenum cofactor guanylyltransferase [Rickettsiales bacterium]